MRLKLDYEKDASYLRLGQSAVVEAEEVRLGVILGYDANDSVVGIEIPGLSRRVLEEMLKRLQFETV